MTAQKDMYEHTAAQLGPQKAAGATADTRIDGTMRAATETIRELRQAYNTAAQRTDSNAQRRAEAAYLHGVLDDLDIGCGGLRPRVESLAKDHQRARAGASTPCGRLGKVLAAIAVYQGADERHLDYYATSLKSMLERMKADGTKLQNSRVICEEGVGGIFEHIMEGVTNTSVGSLTEQEASEHFGREAGAEVQRLRASQADMKSRADRIEKLYTVDFDYVVGMLPCVGATIMFVGPSDGVGPFPPRFSRHVVTGYKDTMIMVDGYSLQPYEVVGEHMADQIDEAISDLRAYEEAHKALNIVMGRDPDESGPCEAAIEELGAWMSWAGGLARDGSAEDHYEARGLAGSRVSQLEIENRRLQALGDSLAAKFDARVAERDLLRGLVLEAMTRP